MEHEKLEGKMWCEQTLLSNNSDRVGTVERSASTVVTA